MQKNNKTKTPRSIKQTRQLCHPNCAASVTTREPPKTNPISGRFQVSQSEKPRVSPNPWNCQLCEGVLCKGGGGGGGTPSCALLGSVSGAAETQLPSRLAWEVEGSASQIGLVDFVQGSEPKHPPKKKTRRTQAEKREATHWLQRGLPKKTWPQPKFQRK